MDELRCFSCVFLFCLSFRVFLWLLVSGGCVAKLVARGVRGGANESSVCGMRVRCEIAYLLLFVWRGLRRFFFRARQHLGSR